MVMKRGPPVGKSRSPSADSNRSAHSNASGGSNRSRSRSRSGSRSPSRSRSRSASGSRASHRSNRSRSGSADSRKSGHSGSRSRSRSGSRSAHSNASIRSGGSRSRSHSKTPSHKSGSRSRSGDRSGSAASGSARSRSHSRSRSRSHSGSRSGSAGSRKSVTSNRSARSKRSGSKTPSHKSGSRSRSGSEKSRSRSHTPQQDKGSGSEEEQKEGAADAADLFGDADDISSDEDKAKETREKAQISDLDDDDHPMQQETERERMSGDERDVYQEEDKEAEVEVPETRIDVKIPKISCDLGKEIHFVKLPNFLSVETRPFDPETYEDEIDEEETLDEEGRARLKLKVENTIRWRQEINKEGDLVNQSNARLVRWSDGSLSLHLGSEIFDVYKQPLQGDHNHLFIRQGTGLQGQAVFRTKLSFRPHSTESFTHRKMTLSLADRSQKTSGIKILSQVGVNPDQDRKTMLKKEEEKLRQTFRQSKPRRRGDGGRSHASQAYREEDGSEDEGAISLNAIKNKYKSGGNLHSKGGAIYSSDEEGSDFEARRSKKLDKPKALKDSESSAESD